MSWSLLNAFLANDVTALMNHESLRDDLPDEERMMSRAECEAVIHAALWAYSSRSSSTAGAMAKMNLFDALNLESWKFKKRVADQSSESNS